MNMFPVNLNCQEIQHRGTVFTLWQEHENVKDNTLRVRVNAKLTKFVPFVRGHPAMINTQHQAVADQTHTL